MQGNPPIFVKVAQDCKGAENYRGASELSAIWLAACLF